MTTHLEALDPRLLLAGDVQIQRSEGLVTLTGSLDEPVSFIIERIDDRTIRVYGDGNGTTVGSDVSRRVRIGRSALAIDLGQTAGSIVQIRDVALAGGVRVEAPAGVGLSIANATLGGLNVTAGEGGGELVTELLGTTVAGSVQVVGGNGSSDLRIDGSTIQRDLIYQNPGEALANLQMSDSRVLGRRTSVGTGDAGDTVSLINCVFAGRFGLSTFHGQDRISFDRTRFGTTRIDDGAGIDAIELRLSYDFNRGPQGWTTGFADYTGTQLEDPVAEHGDLPANIGGRGWRLGVTNRADDTVSYLTRGIGRREGLIGDANYVLSFDVAFASDARSNAPGVGGAEGESVALKMGASPLKPATSGELNRLNIDIGDQTNSGPAASVSGHIANGRDAGEFPDEENKPYVKMNRQHTHTFPVQANPDGSLNLFVGTESGYEGRTVLIYRRVDVTLRTQR